MTRKQLTLHGGFSRNDDIGHLYVPRKIGGRDPLEHEKHNLASYVHCSEEYIWLLVVDTYSRDC